MILRLAILATAMAAPDRLFDRLYRVPVYRRVLTGWVAGLGLRTGARVLELGCGPGGLAIDLAAQGHDVTGADRSARMIRTAARNGGDTGPQWLVADATALPLPDQGFDAVLSASLLNVVPDPAALLSEMARLCRPGGLVSCLVPTVAFTDAPADTPGTLDRALMRTWAALSRKLAPATAAGWMTAAGLETTAITPFLDGGIVAVTARRPD